MTKTLKINLLVLVMFSFTASVIAQQVEENIAPNLRNTVGINWHKGDLKLEAQVEWRNILCDNQLVNLTAKNSLPLEITTKYNVLKSAPLIVRAPILNSVPAWQIYYYNNNDVVPVNMAMDLNLDKKGMAEKKVFSVKANTPESEFSKGIATIKTPNMFRIAKADGEWLRNETNTSWVRIEPPVFLAEDATTEKLTFTVANLKSFKVFCESVESTWEPGGPVRIKLSVTDADGETFPIVNVPATISDGNWKENLKTEYDLTRVPTGWLIGRLPGNYVPEKLNLKAKVSAIINCNPVKKEVRSVNKIISKGEGKKPLAEINSSLKPIKLPRNSEGKIRETRAMWCSDRRILWTKKSIDELVEKCAAANFNVLFAAIFHDDRLLAKSKYFPMLKKVEKGLDPLKYLIDKAHVRGIEVHPYIAVNYRNEEFRKWFQEKFKVNIDSIAYDPKVSTTRKVRKYVVDMQKKAYRDFMVNLIVDIAKNYDVDGIQLDYIRSRANSTSEEARKKFKGRFGKSIYDATDKDFAEWWKGPIGDVVGRTAEQVRAVKPRVIISAAVNPVIKNGRPQGQFPCEWADKHGVRVITMNYTYRSLEFVMNLKNFLKPLGENRELVISGLSLYSKFFPEGKRIVKIRNVDKVRELVTITRSLGIHGFSIYEYAFLDDKIINFLRNEINKEPAVPYFRDDLKRINQ